MKKMKPCSPWGCRSALLLQDTPAQIHMLNAQLYNLVQFGFMAPEAEKWP